MDDLAIVVMGKHLNTKAELMQRNLRNIDTWCNSKRLSANTEKTEVTFFTRRKIKEVVRHKYQGVKLILTKEVKYHW